MESMKKQLGDAQKSGVYQLARSPEEVELAGKQDGLAVFRIDLSCSKDKKDFLKRIATALHFPEWFGGNLDSLNDCLTDLDWLPEKTGYVLLFENGESRRHRQEFQDVIEVLNAAAEYWKKEGRPFWAFIESSAASGFGLPPWPD
jgi:RNAse (barnase) inhibitor barstar